MDKRISLLGTVLVLTSCSSSVNVDAMTVLPGSWLCDDGIVITFNSNGKYEWRVPPDDEVKLYVESNNQLRMNEGGGHSILDNWRINAGALEMDMLGETDQYELEFKSKTKFRMVGPDTFTCEQV